jgi:hypothetical protein
MKWIKMNSILWYGVPPSLLVVKKSSVVTENSSSIPENSNNGNYREPV